jgi:hypothetical protein
MKHKDVRGRPLFALQSSQTGRWPVQSATIADRTTRTPARRGDSQQDHVASRWPFDADRPPLRFSTIEHAIAGFVGLRAAHSIVAAVTCQQIVSFAADSFEFSGHAAWLIPC